MLQPVSMRVRLSLLPQTLVLVVMAFLPGPAIGQLMTKPIGEPVAKPIGGPPESSDVIDISRATGPIIRLIVSNDKTRALELLDPLYDFREREVEASIHNNSVEPIVAWALETSIRIRDFDGLTVARVTDRYARRSEWIAPGATSVIRIPADPIFTDSDAEATIVVRIAAVVFESTRSSGDGKALSKIFEARSQHFKELLHVQNNPALEATQESDLGLETFSCDGHSLGDQSLFASQGGAANIVLEAMDQRTLPLRMAFTGQEAPRAVITVVLMICAGVM